MYIQACIVLGLLTAGCVSSNSLGTMAESETNVTNLSRLSVGMNQSEVLCIMKRPYSETTIELDADTYDVWFYVTTPTAMGQSEMVTANLTPLIFKNGLLTYRGNDRYKWLLKQEKMKSDAQIKSDQDKKNSDEDKPLEKALDTKTTLSMCSRPKEVSAEDSDSDEDHPLKEEDDQMIEMEGEQNFDFW